MTKQKPKLPRMSDDSSSKSSTVKKEYYTPIISKNEDGDKIYICPSCKSKSGTAAPENPEDIFRNGSTTYYYSTKLFPVSIRKEVTQLYNFVRIADNYVDSVPQDTKGFFEFKDSILLILYSIIFLN